MLEAVELAPRLQPGQGYETDLATCELPVQKHLDVFSILRWFLLHAEIHFSHSSSIT